MVDDILSTAEVNQELNRRHSIALALTEQLLRVREEMELLRLRQWFSSNDTYRVRRLPDGRLAQVSPRDSA